MSWKIQTVKTVYDNPWVRVRHYTVINPNGGQGVYGLVSPKSRAVGVVPITNDGQVVMVGQHRFACGDYSWEVPEGGASFDEDPQIGAARELAEETGYAAKHWLPILDMQLSNSITDECASCFVAWGLQSGDSQPDPTEAITVTHVPFGQVLDWVTSGKIKDAMTVAMILRVYQMAVDHKLPDGIAKKIMK